MKTSSRRSSTVTIDNNSEMANPAEGGLTNVNVNYIGG